ncbi:hypothetical protein [Ferruginibacter sp. SUN106]|uniref:hypothetical protein n=1 Tax=Ferruginibacter sp. SUN106 TaxID=2978348 RepID=UPI003D36586C
MNRKFIKKIKECIEKDKLEEAQNFIDDLISSLNEDYKNEFYHECLYLLGIINTKKFSSTGSNQFSNEARTYFTSANNYYLAIHNKNSVNYLEAIQYTENAYRFKNIKIINS